MNICTSLIKRGSSSSETLPEASINQCFLFVNYMCVIHGGTPHFEISEYLVFYLSTGLTEGKGEPDTNLVKSFYKSVFNMFPNLYVLYIMMQHTW